MVKLRIVSDVHAEFLNGNYNLPKMEDEHEQILMCPGDLGVISNTNSYLDILEDWTNRFKHVVYIPGNHEFYNTSMITGCDKLRRDLDFELQGFPSNLSFGETLSLIIDDVAIVCATLWTDIDKQNPVSRLAVEASMNDYRLIRYGTKSEPFATKLRTVHTIATHMRHREFLTEEALKHIEDDRKVVVMTHHAPSFQSIDKKYVGSDLNGGYASELYESQLAAMPNLHIHGHVHANFDYHLGDTRVVCNPVGYHGENANFNPHFVIEI